MDNTNRPPPSLPIAALVNLQDRHDERAWVLDLNVVRDKSKKAGADWRGRARTNGERRMRAIRVLVATSMDKMWDVTKIWRVFIAIAFLSPPTFCVSSN